MQLRIISESGDADHTIPIDESMEIGRAPNSALSLMDSTVSWRHALLWVQEGALWLRDLGSTNGTCLQPPRQGFFLEDLSTGVRHALTPGVLRLDGATAAAMGIQHPGSALVLSPEGALHLEAQGAELPLSLGEPFDLLERQVRVVRGTLAPSGTAVQDDEPWPYRLEISLNGPRGIEAILTDRSSGTAHMVSSENRALLLYVLASQVLQDQREGVRPEAVGWSSDQDVIVGIWGKGGVTSDSALHVLVFRLRKELERAGFDHAFIEKDRRVLRIRLRDILLR